MSFIGEVLPGVSYRTDKKSNPSHRCNQDAMLCMPVGVELHSPEERSLLLEFVPQLMRAFDLAFWRLYSQSELDGGSFYEKQGGSTISLMMIFPGEFYSFHAGDSPYYQMPRDRLGKAEGCYFLNERERHSVGPRNHSVAGVPDQYIVKTRDGYRLGGALAMHQSFGDFQFRPQGHSFNPASLQKSYEGDALFMVASDGVSDYLKAHHIKRLHCRYRNAREFFQGIIEEVHWQTGGGEFAGDLLDDTTVISSDRKGLSEPTVIGVADGHGEAGELFSNMLLICIRHFTRPVLEGLYSEPEAGFSWFSGYFARATEDLLRTLQETLKWSEGALLEVRDELQALEPLLKGSLQALIEGSLDKEILVQRLSVFARYHFSSELEADFQSCILESLEDRTEAGLMTSAYTFMRSTKSSELLELFRTLFHDSLFLIVIPGSPQESALAFAKPCLEDHPSDTREWSRE